MRALRLIVIVAMASADPLPLLPRDSLAMHSQMGGDMKSNLPGMGLLGYGDVVKSITRFTPDNNRYNIYGERTYDAEDKPNLGYMDRETTGARSTGSKSLMNLPGVGKFEYAEEREQGSGILDYSSSLFPFLRLPDLKEQHAQQPKAIFSMDQIRREKYGNEPPSTTTTRPFSPFAPSLITEDVLPESERPPAPFQEIPNIVDENAPVPTRTPSPQAFQPQPDFVAQAASDFIQANTISDNPFEDIALRERGVRRTTFRRTPAADAAWIRAVQANDSKSRDIRRKQVREQVNMLKAEGGFDITEYISNGEWALPLTTVSRSVKFYDCCPEPYPDLTFFLHMRRRTLYYGFNLIMPCILTTMMTLLGFTLPPDAGEKITLQITVLLSICFFLSIVSEMSPPTSEAVPLLGIFFSCCMIVVTASTIFTVYVLNLHYRTPETHEMGATTRAIFLYWLPWMLRMKRPGVHLSYANLPSLFCMRPKRHSESLMRNIKEAEANDSRNNSIDVERRVAHLMHSHVGNGGTATFNLPMSQVPAVDIGQQATLLILQRIYHELKIVTKRMVESDREETAANNWKFAAMVVDRLCLYVFTIFIVASTIGIFWSAPYLVA